MTPSPPTSHHHRTRPAIGPTRTKRLIRDLVAAEHDLIELAHRHRLTPSELAAWINEPANQQALSGLCVLADLQTQILLSRYRLLAAGRLIRLATAEDDADGSGGSGGSGGGSSSGRDVARKACVDLLKLDLKRASVSPPLNVKTAASPDDASDSLDDVWADDPDAPPPQAPGQPTSNDPESLRQWLYGPDTGEPR